MQKTFKVFLTCMSLIGLLANGVFAGQNIDKLFKKTTQTGSRDRQYTVHLPTGYNGSQAYPLVMVLHGCVQDQKTIQHDTDMDRIADLEGFIVVYPYITSYNGMRSENCWGFWFDAEIHRDAGEVGDLRSLVSEVSGDYNIDSNRVYITGLSSGGAMATIAVVAYPDVFAAGAPVSGIAYGETSSTVNMNHKYQCTGGSFESVTQTVSEMDAEMGTRKRPVSLFIAHSEDDCVVNIPAAYNNRDAWLQAFGISSTPTSTETGNTEGINWTHKKYGTLEGRPSNIETHFVQGYDHGWVGGKSGKYSFSNGPDWSQLIWDFFKAHPLSANEKPTVVITSGSSTGTCVDVSGTASDSDGTVSSVEVTLDGNYPQSAGIATGTTNWSYQRCNVPDNARYVPLVVAIDNNGAKSAVVNGSAIDVGTPPVNQPPTLTLDAPAVNETCVTLSGAASDDNRVDKLELRIDTDAWLVVPVQGSSFSYQDCTRSATLHTWDVRATDNESAQTTLAGTDFIISALPYDDVISSNLTDHVAAQRVKYYPEGFGAKDSPYMTLYNAYGSSTVFPLYLAPAGSDWYHDVGNIPGGGGSSDNPPTVKVNPVAEVSDNCVTINGVAEDDNKVVSVNIQLNGGTWESTGLQGNNFSFNKCGLANGMHTSKIKVTDNASPTAQTTTVDGPNFKIGSGNEPPNITLTTANGSNSGSGCIHLDGNATDDNSVANIDVKIGIKAWTAAARNGNNWSFDKCNYAVGTYTTQARATDEAGLSTTVNGPDVTVSSGFTCESWYTHNYDHVQAGRAYDNLGSAYTVGADNYLGLDNIFYYTTVKETSAGYYELGACP